MSLADQIERMMRPDYNPAQAIADDEAARGFTVVRPGGAAWLPASDWNPASVCSINGVYVRLVLIDALRPGTGALTRTLAAIHAAGMIPCIIDPTRELAATLTRRGWKSKHVGTTFEDRETVWTL